MSNHAVHCSTASLTSVASSATAVTTANSPAVCPSTVSLASTATATTCTTFPHPQAAPKAANRKKDYAAAFAYLQSEYGASGGGPNPMRISNTAPAVKTSDSGAAKGTQRKGFRIAFGFGHDTANRVTKNPDEGK